MMLMLIPAGVHEGPLCTALYWVLAHVHPNPYINPEGYLLLPPLMRKN